jgi:hypothetical protein
MAGMIESAMECVRRCLASAVLWGALAAATAMLVALFIAGGIAFGLLAVYLRLAAQLPPPSAALITAGVAVLAAVLIALIAMLVFRIASRPRRTIVPVPAANPEPRSPAAPRGALGAADEAAGWIGRNPLSAIIAAFAAGSAFAVSPPLRRAIGELIADFVRPPRNP